jgi:tRNA A-37 threonylcarbamoyl transferase component Bud32
MLSEKHVSTLMQGDVFRDWLVFALGDRIGNKRCIVRVFKIGPASHIVCRYEFVGEDYSVVAKFYAQPTGWMRNYNPAKAMEREFRTIKKVAQIIDVPRPIAVRKDFACVLITEFIRGKLLYKYMKTEDGLYDRLTAIANMLRKLHDGTKTSYYKHDEFSRFHKVLDQLRLDRNTRSMYDLLLGKWWYSNMLDQPYGCRIHNDANPVNYIFQGDRVYAIDFESSWDHASFVHDLGIVAAELKHYFALHRNNGERAEPYIGHFLWHYSRSEDEFRRITRALPFFMALGYLRMARLGIDADGNNFVFREATACLRAIS